MGKITPTMMRAGQVKTHRLGHAVGAIADSMLAVEAKAEGPARNAARAVA
jgi:hypothetical protein